MAQKLEDVAREPVANVAQQEVAVVPAAVVQAEGQVVATVVVAQDHLETAKTATDAYQPRAAGQVMRVLLAQGTVEVNTEIL